MPAFPAHEPQRLLADATWVQRLAGPLLADEHGAFDVGQEAWLAARQRDRVPSRGFAAGLLRNLARRRRRSEARRAYHEARATPRKHAPATDELVARAEASERVVHAVLELEPELRDTLLLRYFEDLAPRHIADRMGVEVDTVRARTRRALGQLKARLERELGPGGLKALLVPLLAPERGSSLGFALGSVGAVAAVAAVALAGPWQGPSRPGPPMADRVVTASPRPVEPVIGASTADSSALARDLAPANPTPTAKVPTSRGTTRGRVHVFRPDGSPLPKPSGSFLLLTADGEARSIEVFEGECVLDQEEVAGEHEAKGFAFGLGPEHRLGRPDTESFFRGENGQLLIVVRLVPQLVVRAVDEVTGHELPEIELHTLDEGSEWPLREGKTRPPYVTGASPLTVATGLPPGREWLWVTAPDHGWKRLHAPAEDREVRVALPRAGELRVSFPAAPPPRGTRLVLQRLDGRRGIRVDEGDDWEGAADLAGEPFLLLKGVPAGQYLAELEVRSSLGLEAYRLAQADLRIHAGSRSEIAWTLEETSEAMAANFEAELEVPGAWGKRPYRVTLEALDVGPVDQPQPRHFGPEPWMLPGNPLSLEVRELPVGTYLAEVLAYPLFTHRRVIEITADTRVVELSVPEPVAVHLTVVDHASGIPVVPEFLYQGPPELPEVNGGRVFPVPLAEGQGTYEFRAPEGPLTVRAQLPGNRRAQRTFHLRGPHADLRLEVP